MTNSKITRHHLNLLTSLAKDIGYKVIVSTLFPPYSGALDPVKKKIHVGRGVSPEFRVYVILHEVGHVLDFTGMSKKTLKATFDLYSAATAGKVSKKQKHAIIRAEKRAWENGKKVAKVLKIPLEKIYSEFADYCVDKYKELL